MARPPSAFLIITISPSFSTSSSLKKFLVVKAIWKCFTTGSMSPSPSIRAVTVTTLDDSAKAIGKTIKNIKKTLTNHLRIKVLTTFNYTPKKQESQDGVWCRKISYNLNMMNLVELKKQFLEHLEIEKGRSVKTIENYNRYLNKFFEFMGA